MEREVFKSRKEAMKEGYLRYGKSPQNFRKRFRIIRIKGGDYIIEKKIFTKCQPRKKLNQ